MHQIWVQSAFYKFESSPRFTSPVQSAFYNMPERIVSALTAGEWTRAQASYRFDDCKATSLQQTCCNLRVFLLCSKKPASIACGRVWSYSKTLILFRFIRSKGLEPKKTFLCLYFKYFFHTFYQRFIGDFRPCLSPGNVWRIESCSDIVVLV